MKLVEVPIEEIIEADKEMSLTESEANPYRKIIQYYDMYSEAGLTPLIYMDTLTYKLYFTTKEIQEKKLH